MPASKSTVKSVKWSNTKLLDPATIRFMTEKFDRELKNLKLYEQYIPIPGKQSVTSKFYAAHDTLPFDVDPDFLKAVKRRYNVTPKEIFDFPPPTVNMEYGWYIDPFLAPDPRFNHRKVEAEFIRVELEIKEHLKKLPHPPFTGIPFRT